jgi:Spy/CpxP family protein refolding chaperone
MKHALFLIPALIATSLFAQDPGAFGGRRGFNAGPQNGPGDFHGMRRSIHRGMQYGAGMRGMALSRMLENPMLRQQLGVSADQAAKIRQQETDFEKIEIRNRADLQVKRLELNQLISADKPDRAAIDSKVAEVGAAQVAMEKATIDNRLNMRDALTPVQRQRLEQIVAQRRQARFSGNPAFGPGTRGGGAPPAERGGNRGAVPNPPNPPAPRQ